MIRDKIVQSLQKAAGIKDIHLEFPEYEEHGDYATNVALKLKNPKESAKKIVGKLQKDKDLAKIVSKIKVAGPGFINFYLSKEALLKELKGVLKRGDGFGKTTNFKAKKYLIEHTSPNTIKTLHVGHVRNNVLGMAVHNILEFAGADVKLDAINNDRGIHVMKAVWAYQKYGKNKTPKTEKMKPDQFVDQFYVKGAKEAENEDVKEEMQELLRKWEQTDSKVRAAWKKLRDWTLEGFEETYKRLGNHHDHQWFESDFYQEGKKIVEKGIKQKVFKKLPDGAVISQLEKYNLPNTIVLRSDGTSMYHTQDLHLTKLKREKFPSDLYIWDIGPEQTLYLKQLFTICEQLGIGKREDYLHLSYGFVFLKGKEKMSSRKGNVIAADWLMDKMVSRAKKFNKDKKVAEAVGVGAIKYGLLKVGRTSDIYFDIDESLSLEGNSGPYLQYAFARTQSVLNKAKGTKTKVSGSKNIELNEKELLVLRSLLRFPEIVANAARTYSPNLLCNYLFELAQKYNNFYNQHRIIGSENQELRIMLTAAVGQILKNGLVLLGIETPERM